MSMNKSWPVMCLLSVAILGGCNKAKSPEAVASDVAAAQQSAAKDVAKATDAADQSVGKAVDKVDDKANDLNNSEAKGTYDIDVAKAEGARKVALANCDALGGDAQKKCKDQAEADYEAAKANAKAAETLTKQ